MPALWAAVSSSSEEVLLVWRRTDVPVAGVGFGNPAAKPSWCFEVMTMYFMPGLWRRTDEILER